MKKTIITLMVAAAASLMMTSCGGEEKETTKMLPANAVSISGKHASLLEVADSVKVILTNPSGQKEGWCVQMRIPMSNTTKWSMVDDTNPNAESYYIANMGNLHIDYVTENGAEINYDLKPDWDVVNAMIESEQILKQDVMVTLMWENLGGKKYKEAKEVFDKVAGAKISKAELTRGYSSSPSSSSSSASSSSSYTSDDLDDDLQKAIELEKKALKAAGKAAKSKNAKDALDAYGDMLDAYGDMLK